MDVKENKEAVQEKEGALLNQQAESEQHEEKHEEDFEQNHESLAREAGWKPKEEFKGKRWLPAWAFNERVEILDKLHKTNQKNRDLHNSMKNVEELLKKNAEFTRQKTIEELTAARRAAVEEGNVAEAENLSDKILEHKKEIEEIKREKKKETPRDVLDFVERNKSWFNDAEFENSEMKDRAVEIESRLARIHPDMDDYERLSKTEQEIKRLYPHRFENANKRRGVAVEGNTMPVNQKKKYSSAYIPEKVKQVAKDFVRKGVFKTEDDYYKVLADMGNLPTKGEN